MCQNRYMVGLREGRPGKERTGEQHSSEVNQEVPVYWPSKTNKSGALSLVEIHKDTVLWLVEIMLLQLQQIFHAIKLDSILTQLSQCLNVNLSSRVHHKIKIQVKVKINVEVKSQHALKRKPRIVGSNLWVPGSFVCQGSCSRFKVS